MATEEQGVDIPGFEGKYQISNRGKVKDLLTDNIVRQEFQSNGYMRFTLERGAYQSRFYTHILMAEVFLDYTPGRYKDKVVLHKDLNLRNNVIDNLEIVSKAKKRSIEIKTCMLDSQIEGVSFVSKKRNRIEYRVDIFIGSTKVFLGVFDNEKEAKDFYQLAKDNMGEYENPKQFRSYLRLLKYGEETI